MTNKNECHFSEKQPFAISIEILRKTINKDPEPVEKEGSPKPDQTPDRPNNWECYPEESNEPTEEAAPSCVEIREAAVCVAVKNIPEIAYCIHNETGSEKNPHPPPKPAWP